jgi:hypothetical protein
MGQWGNENPVQGFNEEYGGARRGLTSSPIVSAKDQLSHIGEVPAPKAPIVAEPVGLGS